MKLKTSGLVLAMAAAVGAATYYFQDKSPSQQAFEGSNLPFSLLSLTDSQTAIRAMTIVMAVHTKIAPAILQVPSTVVISKV